MENKNEKYANKKMKILKKWIEKNLEGRIYTLGI